eukprot:6212408-Pleurochrysis_carterae.AAC.2
MPARVVRSVRRNRGGKRSTARHNARARKHAICLAESTRATRSSHTMKLRAPAYESLGCGVRRRRVACQPSRRQGPTTHAGSKRRAS